MYTKHGDQNYPKSKRPVTKPEQTIICGPFRALERELCKKLRSLRAETVLAPVAVIVPSEMLRKHLVRAVAADAGCHANIHFLTLEHTARQLAGTRPAEMGLRAEPRFAAQLALAQAVASLETQLCYFAPMAGKEGFQEALLNTFRDLREAGMKPADISAAAERLGKRDFLARKLRDIALLWTEVENRRSARGFMDSRTDLLEIAAKETDRGNWLRGLKAFFLYGFYDFSGLQQKLLAACFQIAPSTVFFPFGKGEAFTFARSALAWLEGIGFLRSDVHLPEKTDTALAALQANLFRPLAECAKRETVNPEGALIISAPGEARETEEIVREVVHGTTAEDHRIGILLRSDSAYGELLHTALAGAGVKSYFNRCLPLAATRAGKTLLLLTGLLSGKFRRTEVMDFLAVAELGPLGDTTEPPPVEIWNQLAIEAGIIEGRNEWDTRLQALMEHDETDRTAALSAFRAFLLDFFAAVQRVKNEKTWAGMAASVCELLQKLTAPSAEMKTVLDRVHTIANLDTPGEKPAGEDFVRILRRAIAEERVSAGRFECGEPTVTPLMQARGVPFDIVIIPGMVEKLFPQAPRQDPILLDGERRQLVKTLAETGVTVNLPGKQQRREEEKLLFTLAVASARHKLALTFPRLDPQTARTKTPSYFLLRSMEAITGAPFDFALLDEIIRGGGIGRFVRITRVDGQLRERALNPVEYDLANLGKAWKNNTPEAMAYLATESRFFRQAVTAESARYGDPHFTRYDAIIESPDARALLERHLAEGRKAISPSRLETYATCPFRYFITSILELKAVEEPERVAVISALDRGSMVHDILADFLAQITRDKELPLRMKHWPRLEKTARNWFRKYERARPVGYALTWQMETHSILSDLQEFLRREFKEQSDFQPAHFEISFGMTPHRGGKPVPVLFDLGDGETIGFRGRIDRIDINKKSAKCRVMDYKTGHARTYKDNSFDGGRKLQLPVYLPAAGQLLDGLEPEQAEYYFATEKGGFRRVIFTRTAWLEKEAVFRKIVRTICDGIRSGRFYAATGDEVANEAVCKYCDCTRLCGAARAANFKWQADIGNTHSFVAMRKME